MSKYMTKRQVIDGVKKALKRLEEAEVEGDNNRLTEESADDVYDDFMKVLDQM